MSLDRPAAERRLPVAGPSIGEREIAYVTEAVTRAWYEDANVFHDRLERAFAERIGVRHAVALPSCTSAIHLALLALDVGACAEVVVPDVTWIATAAPVVYVGATPVFADVDAQTWCVTRETVEARLSSRTRAIIAVDLYGGMADWAGLRALARERGIPLIEDAAEAIGSRCAERMAGALGDIGVFSFHGSKTVTAGEGGMLVTDRDDVAARARVLRDHGRDPGDRAFYNREIAYKYKMSAMQAALALAQLERLDELVAHKRRLFAAYQRGLAGLAGVQLNAEPSGTFNSYWMSTVVLDPALGWTKQALAAELDARGIDTRPFFYPLSALPAFAATADALRARSDNERAYRLSAHGINLPSAACLDEADIARVCEAVRAVVGRAAARSDEAAQ